MERIQAVQKYVDQVLQNIDDQAERECAYKHLYGVSQACALLAMKRRENIELAAIAGLLHDLYTYQRGDSTDHAHKGSILAKDILTSLGCFSDDEVAMVARAIDYHSDKAAKHSSFDEILKDADVLQHCLYNPLKDIAEHEKERFSAIRNELGLR